MKFKSFMEALKGKQHKLDKNKNGELDAQDFKLLRKEESELSEEERMARADYKVGPSGRKSHKEITFKDGSDDGRDDELKREQVELAEESQKHIVSVTVSDPHHTMVSKRKETIQKRATVTAKSRESAIDTALNHYKKQGYKVHDHNYVGLKEEMELEESMADSWKKVQSMDKGSLIRGKEEAKKRLAYLNAVHDHHKKYGNDTKKVKSEIEAINRSRIAEDVELEEGYVVRYNNPKSEKHGSEKHFTDQAAAQKHADRGNSVDKIGGKYTVHKTNEKGHDVNEAYPGYAEKGKKLDAATKKIQANLDIRTRGRDLDAATKKIQSNLDKRIKAVDKKDSAKKPVKEEIELDEAVESGNKGYGYHGQHDSEVADKKYSAMHAKVKKIAGEAGHLRDAKKPNVMVKHYLDSRHGRHLAGLEHDHEYIKKDFGKFKKSYKESGFAKESIGFDDEGNLMAEKKTFTQFVEELKEIQEGQTIQVRPGVTRHIGTYGTAKGAKYGHTDYDKETMDKKDDDDEKPSTPAVKRGRGRPAGSKSGANQKVTSGKSYGGIATHSLHLPNTK